MAEDPPQLTDSSETELSDPDYSDDSEDSEASDDATDPDMPGLGESLHDPEAKYVDPADLECKGDEVKIPDMPVLRRENTVCSPSTSIQPDAGADAGDGDPTHSKPVLQLNHVIAKRVYLYMAATSRLVGLTAHDLQFSENLAHVLEGYLSSIGEPITREPDN